MTTATNLTTRQKLSTGDGVYLAYFIDESNEVKRWGATPDSTEDEPRIHVEVYEEVQISFTEYGKPYTPPEWVW